jgi:acyl carrier protein
MGKKSIKKKVESILREVADSEMEVNIDKETDLYGEGISLDSLDVATLSVRLEEEFGRDPYTEAQEGSGNFPEKVGDILDFYKR